MKLVRGSKKVESIIGMETCSAGDWIVLAVFVVICGCMSAYTLHNYQFE
jgi:hypothetical protein